jgi:hypothetical protein
MSHVHQDLIYTSARYLSRSAIELVIAPHHLYCDSLNCFHVKYAIQQFLSTPRIVANTSPLTLTASCCRQFDTMESPNKEIHDLEISHAEHIAHLPAGGYNYDLPPRGDPALDSRKLGIDVFDAVLDQVAEDDIMAISQACLKVRSRTGLRLAGILFVMGVNQAAYGVDWVVIGNVNAYDTWHNYFGFGNTGTVLATINSLMLIGSVCGAPFLVLSDIFGRRRVNFAGNALSVIGAILQSLKLPILPAS